MAGHEKLILAAPLPTSPHLAVIPGEDPGPSNRQRQHSFTTASPTPFVILGLDPGICNAAMGTTEVTTPRASALLYLFTGIPMRRIPGSSPRMTMGRERRDAADKTYLPSLLGQVRAGCPEATMALRMTMSFRMTAVRTTLLGFPRALRVMAKARMVGL